MSENKREKVKITIEVPNREPQVIECHGVALTTLEDLGDKYSMGAAVIGDMCINDLRALKDNAENELTEAIDESLSECMNKSMSRGKNTLKDFLSGLLDLLSDGEQ